MKTRLLFLFLFIGLTVSAHEVRPGYFSVLQVNDSIYQVTWKVPAMGDAIPKIYPRVPETWEKLGEQQNLMSGNLRRTFDFKITEPIEGGLIRFDGQEKTLIDILLTIRLQNGNQYSVMIKPSNPRYTIPKEPSKYEVVKTYLVLGVEHILIGIDHLFFVLALLLITVGFRKLIKTVTAFTIAHSITLSLSALGVVGLPGPPVEAVIALSIVFLAVELTKHYKGETGLTMKYPWVVAFTFGLLHGFGFAGALADIGLPQAEIPLALLFFNVGVEVGQILFILAVLGFIFLMKRLKKSWPSWIQQVTPYAIGSVAAFWLIERVVGFWG
ncbi:HupE/UreJ family protein [Urechidicola vernalis]|uniref:HupE/UreJ family protein n=1 Tax=Urechidicola vernalis TaxID=3075600 RepID=A0ABU2Y5I4_9FLAO|nr:HupE/UreJ family protein [Urechidicola sp. P050]MDT0553458.1 HupE/UreJ family protein [Urechidicola sp. P050]